MNKWPMRSKNHGLNEILASFSKSDYSAKSIKLMANPSLPETIDRATEAKRIITVQKSAIRTSRKKLDLRTIN